MGTPTRRQVAGTAPLRAVAEQLSHSQVPVADALTGAMGLRAPRVLEALLVAVAPVLRPRPGTTEVEVEVAVATTAVAAVHKATPGRLAVAAVQALFPLGGQRQAGQMRSIRVRARS